MKRIILKTNDGGEYKAVKLETGAEELAYAYREESVNHRDLFERMLEQIGIYGGDEQVLFYFMTDYDLGSTFTLDDITYQVERGSR